MTSIRRAKRDQRQESFLSALSAGASVVDAAKAAGVGRWTPYKWRRADTAFKARWDAAIATSLSVLEREATRRALEGVKKPVYRGGELVGHTTEYSDAMLQFLIKRHGEQQAARTGAGELHEQVKGARETLYEKLAGALESRRPAAADRKPQ